MNEQRIVAELLEMLEANGVAIRTDALGGSGGGLCRLAGRPVFFHDTDAEAGEVAVACAEAVAKVVDIETVYLRPDVRQFIDEHRD